MIKKIIFDVDGTLLNTEKDCLDSYNEYFMLRGLESYNEFGLKLFNIIDSFDSTTKDYNKEDLCRFINDYIGIEFTKNDFEDVFKIYQSHGTLINDDVVSSLEKLSKRFELVALSKWYVEDQRKRLEKAGILRYFKKVYGVENAGLKPSKEAYMTACGENKVNECLMVGDSMISDIGGARQIGMEAVLIDLSGTKKYKNKIKSVNELEDLINRRYL